MTHIFADNAPSYWAHSLPAIPLIQGEKRPAPAGWQVFAERMPDDEERAAWLRQFANGNIGLPMGPQSGLVAIDIDTDDPRVIKILDDLLPWSPWERVGKKGMVRIFKYRGEKTTRLSSDNQMICEILSKGTQIVLPPSIHPETKAPYVANTNLFDVLTQIPFLPVGFEDSVRAELRLIGIEVGSTASHKITNFVASGNRDNSMVWHAGILARAVTRGERTLKEALGELTHWCENYVENVVGDPLDPRKAQGRLVNFLVRDVTGPQKMGLPDGWDDGLTDEEKEGLGLSFTDDDEIWTAARIMEALAVCFQANVEPGGAGQMAGINEALARMAKAKDTITAIDEDRIIKFIQTQTANMITMTSLRKELKNQKKGDIEGENHDEIAKAVHEHLNERGGEVRHHAGSFWQWKGSHWEKMAEDTIIKIIANDFGNFPTCKRTTDYHGVLKLMKSIAGKELKLVNLKGINFANGYLSERLELVDHHPDYGITYVLPYRYLPGEERNMPLFNAFLVDSWGQDPDFEDKVAALQEIIGATLFSEATKYQRAICLFGQAGSGKSVMSQIVRSLLPKTSLSSIPPEQWGDKFLPAELFGKVLNFAGELSEHKYIPGEIFKQIIEGEQITSQHKNQAPFDFRPVAAQWFNSNHLPKTRDTSSGFNRRWLFLHWPRTVPADKIIPGLAQIIVDAEREAIVAWAVRGFERLLKNNDYTLPTSHMALVDQMATDNNSVRHFLAESHSIIVGQQRMGDFSVTETTANDLYNEYWQFCLASGVAKRVTFANFVKMMRELEHSFNFKTHTRVTTLGATEAVFSGIIPATMKRKAA